MKTGKTSRKSTFDNIFRGVTQLQWVMKSEKSGQLSVKMNLMYILIIEVFHCVRGINPSYLSNMFISPASNYDFRNPPKLSQSKINTYKFGYKSLRYFGSKVWNIDFIYHVGAYTGLCHKIHTVSSRDIVNIYVIVAIIFTMIIFCMLFIVGQWLS